MKHRYYDFCLKFATDEDVKKAYEYYTKTYQLKYGGKYEFHDGVVMFSIRDDFQVVPDFYRFGLKRFLVADDFHGYKRENGKEVFVFLTETGEEVQFDYDKGICAALNEHLVANMDYYKYDGKEIPILKKFEEAIGYDDLYDILNVDVPGLDY